MGSYSCLAQNNETRTRGYLEEEEQFQDADTEPLITIEETTNIQIPRDNVDHKEKDVQPMELDNQDPEEGQIDLNFDPPAVVAGGGGGGGDDYQVQEKGDDESGEPPKKLTRNQKRKARKENKRRKLNNGETQSL